MALSGQRGFSDHLLPELDFNHCPMGKGAPWLAAEPFNFPV